MKISQASTFLTARLENKILTEQERSRLFSKANEEMSEELTEMVNQAQSLAEPVVLFGVCPVNQDAEGHICVNGLRINSQLVRQKMQENNRCFPYVATCGEALEAWSLQYKDDFLAAFWAEEIKNLYLNRIVAEFFAYLKTHYQVSGHLASLNPGSLEQWTVRGQKELFEVLGGTDFVKEQTGVVYTDTFLMLPIKSLSGICFESNVFFENCQHCPLTACPNRRAPHKAEENTGCIIH